MVARRATHPEEGAHALRRAHRTARRRACAARDARHGQAHPRLAGGRRAAPRHSASPTTARPSTRCTTRSRLADPKRGRAGHARAARRGRAGRAVELPAVHGRVRSAPRWRPATSVVLKPAEHSTLTALRLGELAVEAGLPDGRAERRAGARRDRRPGAGPHMDVDMVTFTGSTEVGKLFPAIRGRVEHEARPARVRRQVPAHRLADARSRRGRQEPRGGSSTTRARSAARAPGSSSTTIKD